MPCDTLVAILFYGKCSTAGKKALIGDIDNVSIRMPSVLDDRRKLTWYKLIVLYCYKNLANKPQGREWCWLVPANHSAGGKNTSSGWTCRHKISHDGNKNWYVCVCFKHQSIIISLSLSLSLHIKLTF